MPVWTWCSWLSLNLAKVRTRVRIPASALIFPISCDREVLTSTIFFKLTTASVLYSPIFQGEGFSYSTVTFLRTVHVWLSCSRLHVDVRSGHIIAVDIGSPVVRMILLDMRITSPRRSRIYRQSRNRRHSVPDRSRRAPLPVRDSCVHMSRSWTATLQKACLRNHT